MKLRSICTTFLCSFGLMAAAQTPSDCTVDQTLKLHYETDVKHLALKRILDNNGPAADEIVIPDSWTDTIWQALAAIYNVEGIPERDEVFDQHCIHHTNFNFMTIHNGIIIGIDPSVSWASNWMSGETTTGDTALDELLATYGFEITDYLTFSNAGVFSTVQNLNVTPLFELLEGFDSIVYAEPNYIIGGANQITYHKEDDSHYFDFRLEWADCFSGCINSKTWQFLVHPDCSVELLNVIENILVDDPVPAPVNCNISSAAAEVESSALSVFPNPVHDVLFVNVEKPTLCKIINSNGQEMLTSNLQNGVNEIQMHQLPGGVYLVMVYGEHGQIHKVVKP